jgi:phosphate transport system substrate-binding protein
MSNKSTWVLPTFIIGASLALIGCGCGNPAPTNNEPTSSTTGGATSTASNVSGTLTIDGSTTVYPIVSILGEDFGKANSGIKVSVNKSGTGSGFKKFIEGNLDIATASRPIKEDEMKSLEAKKIEFVEIPVAYDGLSVIVNPQNTWAADITAAELKTAWSKDSTVSTWDQINPKFPKEKITFYGPTDNHGTYEYFTEAINGKKNEIRKNYQPSQEFTAIINAVAGDKSAMAFIAYNYFAENKDKVKSLTVNGVGPEEKTIADGTYKPLSRPLFIYVNKKSMDRPEVKSFVEFALGEKGKAAVTESKYVLLGDDVMTQVKAHVAAGTAGTMMKDFKPGMKLSDVYAKK